MFHVGCMHVGNFQPILASSSVFQGSTCKVRCVTYLKVVMLKDLVQYNERTVKTV